MSSTNSTGRPAKRAGLGKADLDRAIAAAGLVARPRSRSRAGRRDRSPRAAIPHPGRPRLCADRSSRRSAAAIAGIAERFSRLDAGEHRADLRRAVQMRVHGDDAIEILGEQLADHALADRFACDETRCPAACSRDRAPAAPAAARRRGATPRPRTAARSACRWGDRARRRSIVVAATSPTVTRNSPSGNRCNSISSHGTPSRAASRCAASTQSGSAQMTKAVHSSLLAERMHAIDGVAARLLAPRSPRVPAPTDRRRRCDTAARPARHGRRSS